jgi:hypothetical protein
MHERGAVFRQIETLRNSTFSKRPAIPCDGTDEAA